MGLVIGKPLGISLFTLLAQRLKLGLLPEGMTLTDVIGTGILCGIGFTMSLFITVLGFQEAPEMVSAAKTGILFSSVVSAIAASLWFCLACRLKK